MHEHEHNLNSRLCKCCVHHLDAVDRGINSRVNVRLPRCARSTAGDSFGKRSLGSRDIVGDRNYVQSEPSEPRLPGQSFGPLALGAHPVHLHPRKVLQISHLNFASVPRVCYYNLQENEPPKDKVFPGQTLQNSARVMFN